MDSVVIYEKIKSSLTKIGVIADEINEQTNLLDLIEDSIMFVQFIIELEQEFGIDVPDKYLSMEVLNSLTGIEEMIESALSQN